MERILFGDNQFFGVNHMSEEKARAQAMQFKDTASIMRVLDEAYDCGINVFMCTTHDRVGRDRRHRARRSPERYPDFEFYPCMPYAHKYANSVGEVGILETIRRFAPGGAGRDPDQGRLLGDDPGHREADADPGRRRDEALRRGPKTPIDLRPERGDRPAPRAQAPRRPGRLRPLHPGASTGPRPGFITMNLPAAGRRARAGRACDNPIVCANINKIGFRMSGGVDAYRDVLRAAALPSHRHVGLRLRRDPVPGRRSSGSAASRALESIVFGASSAANIRQTQGADREGLGDCNAWRSRGVAVTGTVSHVYPARRRVRFLNVEVDDITMDELVDSFREGLLLTLHVDMIMKLQQDREFYDILPEFDVVTCDSQILVCGSQGCSGHRCGSGCPGRTTSPASTSGTETTRRSRSSSAAALRAWPRSPAAKMNAKVGREMIVGTDSPPVDYDRRPGEIDRMLARINDSGATVLVVGLGAGRQEKFIVRVPPPAAFGEDLPAPRRDHRLRGRQRSSDRRPGSPNAGFEWLYRLASRAEAAVAPLPGAPAAGSLPPRAPAPGDLPESLRRRLRPD